MLQFSKFIEPRSFSSHGRLNMSQKYEINKARMVLVKSKVRPKSPTCSASLWVGQRVPKESSEALRTPTGTLTSCLTGTPLIPALLLTLCTSTLSPSPLEYCHQHHAHIWAWVTFSHPPLMPADNPLLCSFYRKPYLLHWLSHLLFLKCIWLSLLPPISKTTTSPGQHHLLPRPLPWPLIQTSYFPSCLPNIHFP